MYEPFLKLQYIHLMMADARKPNLEPCQTSMIALGFAKTINCFLFINYLLQKSAIIDDWSAPNYAFAISDTCSKFLYYNEYSKERWSSFIVLNSSRLVVS